MKLFSLLMSLVTRFVNILMTSMYLSFHIAMLWSENTKWMWAKNIWSFVWDILVTPLIAAYVWICILILWFFADVVWSGSEWLLYFWANSWWTDYQSHLFTWMIMLIILWWMLNKLQKLVEFVWANFENIISSKWGQGMPDSYSNPAEAMNASSKVWWMAKTTWKYMGLWYAWGKAKAAWMVAWVAVKEGAVWMSKAWYKWTKSIIWKWVNKMKYKLAKKPSISANNTKINKK